MPTTDNRKLADQAGILAIGRLLAVLSEALVMLVVVRLMGKAEVGALTAVLLVYQTSVLVAQLGFPASVMYFVPGRPAEERRAISWAFIRLLLGMGLVTAAVLCLIASYALWSNGAGHVTAENAHIEASDTLRYLFFLAPLPLLELPARILPNLLVAEERARTAAGLSVFRTLGNSLSMLIPISLGAELHVIALCMVGFGVLQFLLLLHLVRDLYRDVERTAAPVTYRVLLKFAFPLGLTSIAATINNRIDRYLILGFYSAARFAEYQAGAFQIPFITNVPYDVGTVLSPKLRELFSDGKAAEAIEQWRASIRKVALLVVPVTMVFFVAAEETMTLLFTSEYESAANVFRCYSALSMGRVAAFGAVIVAAGQSRQVLNAAIFSLVSNVLLSVPLLMLVGFIGPALGTALAFVPMVVVYCYYIARAAKLPLRSIFPLKSYLKVVLLSAVAAGPALAIKLTLSAPPAVSLALQGVALLGSFALLGTWTREISRDDWHYLAGFFKLRPVRRS